MPLALFASLAAVFVTANPARLGSVVLEDACPIHSVGHARMLNSEPGGMLNPEPGGMLNPELGGMLSSPGGLPGPELLGGNWAGPRQYVARHVRERITIDGNAEKPSWTCVPWSEDFVDIQGSDAPQGNRPTSKTRTRIKMRWDEKYLYVLAEMQACDWPIVAKQTARNAVVFSTDSDFEVFVDPDGSNHNYKELELNALNTVWNLMLDKPYSDGGQEFSARTSKPGEPCYWEVQDQRTSAVLHHAELNHSSPQGKWGCEIALSHLDTLGNTSLAGTRPQVGDHWRINFSRVEEKGKLNWVWSPQMVWDPQSLPKASRHRGVVNMHFPDVWGYVLFAGAAQQMETLGGPSVTSDRRWPLKSAAHQLFMAQRKAAEEGHARPVSLEVLEEMGWIDAKHMSQFRPKISTTTTGPQGWHACLRDRDGFEATIWGNHLLQIWQAVP